METAEIAKKAEKTTIYLFNGKKMCHACWILARNVGNRSMEAHSKKKIYAKDYHIFSVGCKRWQCPVCGKKKAQQYAKQIKAGLQATNVKFATLTIENWKDNAQALPYMSKCWNRLRLSLQRKFGAKEPGSKSKKKKLSYVRVTEFGSKNGRPHFHILLEKYIPQKVLSQLAHKAGFGKVVDIRAAKTEKVFNYIVKYVCKSEGNCGNDTGNAPRKFRRVVVSRNFNLAPQKEKTFEGITMFAKDTFTDGKSIAAFAKHLHAQTEAENTKIKGTTITLSFKELLEVNKRTRISAEEFAQEKYEEYIARLMGKPKEETALKDFMNYGRKRIKFTPREEKIIKAIKSDIISQTAGEHPKSIIINGNSFSEFQYLQSFKLESENAPLSEWQRLTGRYDIEPMPYETYREAFGMAEY